MSWFRKKTIARTTGEWTPSQFEVYEKQLLEMNKMYLQERNECLAKLEKKDETDPLETYWNNKRDKSELTYPARPIANKNNNVNVDPRIFWTTGSVPTVEASTNDEKAMKALQYVINNVTYTPDKTLFTLNEEWLFCYETLFLKKGDCEDGAILMANIMLKSGIPYWRIRLNAGDVQGGGHCWVTYLREADNKWYILDWCYWPDESENFKTTFEKAQKYYKIWFSWNTKYIYQDEKFERTNAVMPNEKSKTRGKSKTKA